MSDELSSLMEEAAQGDAGAQCTLGNRYYHGEGMRKNRARAAQWLEKAAAQGHAEAQARLEALCAQK